MIDFMKRIIPNKVKAAIRQVITVCRDGYATKSYSQEGEDMILRKIFENRDMGFYVDVGAHHPKRFSNTYYFYKLGWRGINIDARPGCMEAFNKVRPRDINIEAAIAGESRDLTYYMFTDPALNTFDKKLASEYSKSYEIIGEKVITTQRLDKLLSQNLPADMKVSFMTVDVEGLDLEVLESNDWQRLRPEYLLVECLQSDLDRFKESRVYVFLTGNHYVMFAKALNTVIFKDTLAERQQSSH